MDSEDRDTLIVGLDDSNHAGTAKGEIVVATFSYLPEDSIVRRWRNRRDRSQVGGWLKDPRRDFLFMILSAEKYRHSPLNLPTVAPEMIGRFVSLYGAPKTLKVYFDGHLTSNAKKEVRARLSGISGIERITLDNFIKKHNHASGFSKRPFCPAVVYCADTIANYLYSQTTSQELLEHPKLISSP